MKTAIKSRAKTVTNTKASNPRKSYPSSGKATVLVAQQRLASPIYLEQIEIFDNVTVIRKNGKPIEESDRDQVLKLIDNEFSTGLNIYVESAEDLLKFACTLLGEKGRKTFLQAVGEALDEQGADPKHRWAWSEAVRAI